MNSETGEARRSALLFPLLFLLACLVTVFVFDRMGRTVDESIALTEGDWLLNLEELPAWFPPDFRGTLRDLNRVPAEVSLRTLDWKERVKERMLRNPWIESVDSLERVQGVLHYTARFVRPVLAVQCHEGFVLLDSSSRVIDIERSPRLSPEWGIPALFPRSGALRTPAPGMPVRSAEVSQAMAVMIPVLQAGVPDRWPGVLREIGSTLGRDRDHFWMLVLDTGTEVEWGRSAASELPLELADRFKAENLVRFLRTGPEARKARLVELWVRAKEPYVSSR